MGVVLIMDSQRHRDELLSACDEVICRSGQAEGLLVRMVAPTEQGLVLIHVWESRRGPRPMAPRSRHRLALRACGMMEPVHERMVRAVQTHHIEIAATQES